uniref:Uncharacterized protein n=1 Tax=Bionectria ochroleuca TaxID=29856 RepID=A0A8H7K8W2_BIOOC
MADLTLLEALEAFHHELVAVQEGRSDPGEVLAQDELVQAFESELERLWSRPSKNEASRGKVKSGKITFGDAEYSVNEDFQQTALSFSDEVDLDELVASQYLLESQDDPSLLGRSLLECALIRFHRQRRYVRYSQAYARLGIRRGGSGRFKTRYTSDQDLCRRTTIFFRSWFGKPWE